VLPFDDFGQPEGQSGFSLGLTEEVITDLSRFKELSVFSRSTT
jgi:TolB-like protein